MGQTLCLKPRPGSCSSQSSLLPGACSIGLGTERNEMNQIQSHFTRLAPWFYVFIQSPSQCTPKSHKSSSSSMKIEAVKGCDMPSNKISRADFPPFIPLNSRLKLSYADLIPLSLSDVPACPSVLSHFLYSSQLPHLPPHTTHIYIHFPTRVDLPISPHSLWPCLTYMSSSYRQVSSTLPSFEGLTRYKLLWSLYGAFMRCFCAVMFEVKGCARSTLNWKRRGGRVWELCERGVVLVDRWRGVSGSGRRGRDGVVMR